MKTKDAVILVGHGGTASDMPRPMIEELKRLEAQRLSKGCMDMSEREKELDAKVRQWPRTPETDPYKFGVEKIAEAMRRHMSDQRVVVAYNEFCAPTVQEAIDALADQGFTKITIAVTMFTQGGIHSEVEIPQIVAAAVKKYPNICITYAWPFDADFVAQFLAMQVKKYHPAMIA